MHSQNKYRRYVIQRILGTGPCEDKSRMVDETHDLHTKGAPGAEEEIEGIVGVNRL